MGPGFPWQHACCLVDADLNSNQGFEISIFSFCYRYLLKPMTNDLSRAGGCIWFDVCMVVVDASVVIVSRSCGPDGILLSDRVV